MSLANVPPSCCSRSRRGINHKSALLYGGVLGLLIKTPWERTPGNRLFKEEEAFDAQSFLSRNHGNCIMGVMFVFC